jgi:23S rRNA (uracil1939-C5)-methyltransferase
MAGTNHIVPVKSCVISIDEVNMALETLPDTPLWEENFKKIKEISIETSLIDKKSTLLFHIREKLSKEFINALLEIPFIKVVGFVDVNDREKKIKLIHNNDPYRLFQLSLTENDTHSTIMAKPGSFVQNNWDINLKIINYIQSIFKGLDRKNTLLDLHTGIGNYLFPASPYFKNLVGCDVAGSSIDDCRHNAKNLGINATIYQKSAKNTLLELIKKDFKADCIILDPPRGGCPEIINLLPQTFPDTIIYISCDPPALARDLKNFEKLGFNVESIRLFDMFPQTYHLESVTILKK